MQNDMLEPIPIKEDKTSVDSFLNLLPDTTNTGKLDSGSVGSEQDLIERNRNEIEASFTEEVNEKKTI